jgi:hypothetical protein
VFGSQVTFTKTNLSCIYTVEVLPLSKTPATDTGYTCFNSLGGVTIEIILLAGTLNNDAKAGYVTVALTGIVVTNFSNVNKPIRKLFQIKVVFTLVNFSGKITRTGESGCTHFAPWVA